MAEFIKQSEAAKARLGASQRRHCCSLALPRSTYRRWHGRFRAGSDIIRPPGPKKCQPLPLEALKTDLAKLAHAAKRTGGTGLLYERYSSSVSRRALQSLVAEARAEQNRLQRSSLLSVQWHHPNLAWATDASEYHRDGQGQKLKLVVVQDLNSSFRFAPMCALTLSGEAIAGYLEDLFEQHGAPLVLKRDNGSIFNSSAVDAVLSHWQVLPLNSPVYYPPYNGGIERGIGELKAQLPAHLIVPPAWDLPRVETLLRALCLEQNNQPRRALDQQSASQRFYTGPRQPFGKRQRANAFESIRSDMNARLKQMENPNRRDFHACWRKAMEHWLVCQDLITISLNQTSVTPFSGENGLTN
jgi:transposase InsO family protein